MAKEGEREFVDYNINSGTHLLVCVFPSFSLENSFNHFLPKIVLIPPNPSLP
jgi:hypothetical protein